MKLLVKPFTEAVFEDIVSIDTIKSPCLKSLIKQSKISGKYENVEKYQNVLTCLSKTSNTKFYVKLAGW